MRNDVKKSGPPKHQNKFAFRHNKNSKKTQVILANPTTGLCQKCYDVVEWKKQYRKYKPLTQPAKCNNCQQKTVTKAYHVLCDKCTAEKQVCAKCMEKRTIFTSEMEQKMITEKTLEEEEVILRSMPERVKRTVIRKLQNGEQVEGFVDLWVNTRTQKNGSENAEDGDDNDDEDLDSTDDR